MSNQYQHKIIGRDRCDLPLGKVVCVGRNYAEHAKELSNPIPSAPLLFMKPATALVSLSPRIYLPTNRGSVHHELEMALVLGAPLRAASAQDCIGALAGVGVALDLTLRAVQDQLKQQGHPWEIAKSFDGACPCSEFVPIERIADLQNIELKLERNGHLQQQGNTRDMLFPVAELLASISQHFSLQPGDMVLTGTPAGVGPLQAGDQLIASLGDYLTVRCEVQNAI